MIEQKDNGEINSGVSCRCYDLKKSVCDSASLKLKQRFPRWIPVGQLLPQKERVCVVYRRQKDTLGGCEKV
ncbi:MAG: hypothetical protein IPM37_23025 [Hahellaceae bacterium]|nr:hypothetical protein [Hahellaceae bacterium]